MTIVTELAKVIKNCIHAESSVFCKFISISNIFLSASINMKEKLTSAEADFMPGSSSGPVASKVIKSNQEGISKPVKIDISRDIQGIFKGYEGYQIKPGGHFKAGLKFLSSRGYLEEILRTSSQTMRAFQSLPKKSWF